MRPEKSRATWPIEAIRTLDSETIARGFPGLLLMEAAGAGAARLAGSLAAGPVTIVTGAGNNAGDGFCVARQLAAIGRVVRVLALRDPEGFEGGSDARLNASWARLFGTSIEVVDADGLAAQDPSAPTLVVDALLGTGTSGAPRRDYAAAISWINRARGPILALDVPSGICPTSGRRLGEEAVRATHTATFGKLKPGFIRGEGPDHVGELTLVPLPYPPSVVRAVAARFGL